jgi:hypothetical protein
MEAMTKHRSNSTAFKRQVPEEFIVGETLLALAQWHEISRQLIRIWVGKFEADALDGVVRAGRNLAPCTVQRGGKIADFRFGIRRAAARTANCQPGCVPGFTTQRGLSRKVPHTSCVPTQTLQQTRAIPYHGLLGSVKPSVHTSLLVSQTRATQTIRFGAFSALPQNAENVIAAGFKHPGLKPSLPVA